MEPADDASPAPIEMFNRRSRPCVIILNRELDVVCAEPRAFEVLSGAYPDHPSDRILPESLREQITAALRDVSETGAADGAVMFSVATLSVRVVPLEGNHDFFLTLLLEPVARRDHLRRAANHYSLTKRESEVLSCLLQGAGPAQVAAALAISRSTVKDHVKSLLKKTDARTRSEMLVKVYDVHD